MITFNNHPYWWSPSSTDITSGSVEIAVRRNGAKQDATSFSSPISLTLPNSAKPAQAMTTWTVYPDVIAMFVVNISHQEGASTIVVLTVDGKDTPVGNMMFRFCEGKVADIECQEINDCSPCCNLWSFNFG